jgi:hypothetical protein
MAFPPWTKALGVWKVLHPAKLSIQGDEWGGPPGLACIALNDLSREGIISSSEPPPRVFMGELSSEAIFGPSRVLYGARLLPGQRLIHHVCGCTGLFHPSLDKWVMP